MPMAATPRDEADRLAELLSYEILDTPVDPRFQVFVELAAAFFEVPIALVSLVDAERQWFKAEIGLGAVCETSREMSFCAHAILAPHEVMVVEDARLDARFADNDLVTGSPHIRFYAGAAIVGARGHALGTLCIIDVRPRLMDAAGRRQLAALATGVGSVLELHHSLQQMQRAALHDPLTGLANRSWFEPELQRAVQAAGAGTGCAVLCLDLDRFKIINDTYGHAQGDAVLRDVACRLRSVIRPTDLAGRLGGDEFAILMRGPFPPSAPQRLGMRILSALASPVVLEGAEFTIGGSIGYACAPPHRDAGKMLLAADKALYAAKQAGRGRVVAAPEPPAAAAVSSACGAGHVNPGHARFAPVAGVSCSRP